ncbi:MAG: hypothetical protein Pg6C_09060 [Treponemataceae bacterium]|nr:MAG: hypothetical protein Pg6C_09060 [Treponemataceae bacterium]
MKTRVLFFLTCAVFSANAFCADPVTVTVDPYTKDEFPAWARHIRRTEIITLGSLPFATLATTLGFGISRYISHDFNASYFPNPLAKTSSDANLTKDEQLAILAISAGISLVLGLTDLTINLIKAYRAKKNQNVSSGAITVTEMTDKPADFQNEAQPEVQSGNGSAAKFEYFFYRPQIIISESLITALSDNEYNFAYR